MQGLAYFAGIDASGGITVKVNLPSHYRGYRLRSCPYSDTEIHLPASEFFPGVIDHKHVIFGANLQY
jgi:hypothetical protein